MFGLYRFLLAVLVALSHFGFQFAGFNPGQWAVISFYTLSGLLMERQCKKLSRTGSGTFYLDRFLRIYPLYFVVLLLAWFENRCAWKVIIINAALLPLNYSDFIGIPALLSAQAWSLACEVHFYILVPLLVLCSTRMLHVILLSSLLLFAGSPFLFNSTFWAFSGLPGVLFVFVSGILINRKDFLFMKMLWMIVAILLRIFVMSKLFHTGLPTGIHINICLGYLIATVMIPCLDQYSPKVKWDRILGLFSYPLFLCHTVAADFMRAHFSISNSAALLFTAFCLSAILILIVEIPFDRVRYGLRPK